MRIVPVINLLVVAIAGCGVALPAAAQDLPRGNYVNTCPAAAVVDGVLIANCKTADGTLRPTTLPDAAKCSGTISNENGRLKCNPAQADNARTTKTDDGYASFHDGCPPQGGAPYIVVRKDGFPENPLKFTIERGGSVHLFVAKGTTFAGNCGTYPSVEGPWKFLALE